MMFNQFPQTRSVILFSVLAGFAVTSHAAYVAPVGIPTPTFCVDDVAPDTPAAWPANEVAGYYYIDNTHPNRTDVDNTYGYPGKPRASIPSTYDAGDYAEIHGGPYTGRDITITSNGTSTNPVWIRGSSAMTKPVIRQHLKIQGSYANLENLVFDTSRKNIRVIYSGVKTSYICIRNNELFGENAVAGSSTAIGISGSSGNVTSNVVIYNNLIHDLGNKDRTIDQNDYVGIFPGQYSRYVWILDNHIYNMGGDSILVGQAKVTPVDEQPHYIYIGNNLLHDDRENALDIKRANDVIISRNEMHGYARSTSSSGEVVVIHNGADNVWVLSNTIYDGNFGIVTTGSTNTYFIGNTISDIRHPEGASWDPDSGYSSGAAIHFRSSSTTGGAIHNTIYNYDTGIQLTQGGATGYDIQNNILSERVQPAGWDIKVGESDVAAGTAFDYNLIYQPNGEARIGWNKTAPDNVALFNLSTGKCANCLENIDPQFIDPSIRNFKVRGGSPAMNSGINHPVFAVFSARYDIDIREDIVGNPRTLGPAPEIGAYELIPPETVTSPQAVLLPE